MIPEEIKNKLFENVKKAIIDNVRIDDGVIGKSIWAEFSSNFEKAEKNIDLLSDFINKIYLIFDIKSDGEKFFHLLDDGLDKKFELILKKLRGIPKKTHRPQRYLCYSFLDETYISCGLITKKNMKIIEDLLFLDGVESLFENMDEKEYDKMILDTKDSSFLPFVKKGIPYQKLSEFENLIMKYGHYLVNNNDISLEQFSEFVEKMIPNYRGSCCWITI
jgi:hypothetical protein